MDKETFDKKVKEYMLLSKRTLAEMLAIRENTTETFPKIIDMKINRGVMGCQAIEGFCTEKNCETCLFNERRKELEQKMFDDNRMFLVDPRNLPQYTTTHTGDVTGGFVTITTTETDTFKR